MPKNLRITTLMNSQHVKGSETLHKSKRQHFCHIFRLLCKKIRLKSSVLVVSEILRLFVNILIPDDKYSCSVKASVYRNQFKCNQKIFSQFFSAFPKFT